METALTLKYPSFLCFNFPGLTFICNYNQKGPGVKSLALRFIYRFNAVITSL